MRANNPKPSSREEKSAKAQPARSINGRNTKSVPDKQKRQRSRAWCFTLNNYKENDIGTLTQPNEKITKYLFQEEISKTGTPHLQGCMYLKNPVGLMTMKQIHGRAHWEVSRNWNASLNYCGKEDTRNGEIYMKNVRPPKCKGVEINMDEVAELDRLDLEKTILENIKGMCFEVGHRKGCMCKQK